MTRSQQYIDMLLDHVPKWELQNFEHRNVYDQIKEALVTAENFREKLLLLYKVKGFSDFALSLLWIADRVEQDPSLTTPTREEEALVFQNFRKAVGEEVSQESTPSSFMTSSDFFTPTPPTENTFTGFEQTSGFEQTVPPEGMFGSEGTVFSSQGFSGGADEEKFAQLLDQFREAIQTGAEDRNVLLQQLIRESQTMLVAATETSVQEFYRLLLEFFQYVDANQYIDDVRVMNITSNIQEPYAQWSKLPPEQRSGILEPALDILRDFKAMFE